MNGNGQGDLSADVDEALVGCTCAAGYKYITGNNICMDINEWWVWIFLIVERFNAQHFNDFMHIANCHRID